jgi:3alpha(or 20beta)-hydroxysteroid dehydrogenase
MPNRLEGKVVIVTGATRGMGEAIARGIVAHGGKVVLGGRSSVQGQSIADGLGPNAVFAQLDVGSEADWEAAAALASQRFGKIDGLVNCAGVMGKNPLAETSLALLHDLISTNQIGVLLGMKYCIPAMRAAGGGSIVNIGSIGALRGMADISAYSGTKAAVSGISRSAAMELASANIRVNTIHPGVFATQMLEDSMGSEGLVYGAQVTPLGRVGQPHEMVGPVVFLLSEESSFVTGSTLSVDGGLSL